jgi:mRNA interferase MazF
MTITLDEAVYEGLKRKTGVTRSPLTSHIERLYPGEALVTVAGQSSKAMADQIMAADKSRLTSPLGQLSKADMLAVENVVKLHLALPR